MINNIFITAFVVALIIILQWKELKQGTRETRWVVFSVLVVSGVLWVYIATWVHVPRPAMWLETILEPFDPIK